MGLLTPLFLLGLLTLALPWWLHRLETQVTEREKFATTRFLEASKKRIHVQRKLKYLLLMAIRMAFLALLALAFARPVLFDEPGLLVSEDTVHHVIVLDTSFSMHAGERMATARLEAGNVLDDMAANDIASLYTASSNVETLAGATANGDDLRALLGAVQPDNGRLDLGAMVSELDGLIEDAEGNIQLHFIGDFQQSGQALRFADMIPDVINNRPVQLDLRAVTNDNVANSYVESVVVENRNRISASVRSSNIGEDSSGTREVVLSINGVEQQRQSVNISASGVQLAVFENVSFSEGDNRVDIALQPADALAEDDLRHTVFDNAPPAPVLLLTADTGSLGVTYLSAALETAPRGYVVEAVDLAEFDARVMQRYPWLIVEDIGSINAGLEAALRDYINGGGAVLAAAGPRAGGLSTLPILGNSIAAPQLGPDGRPLKLPITRIDTSHPALSDSSGWSSINARVLPVETQQEDRVLIAQNARNPVLIERQIGAGRLMLFTAGFDNSSADLPVKPVFVTFMAEVAQYLSNEKLLVKQQLADSYLQLTQSGGSSGQVVDPDGETLLSLQDTTRNQDVRLTKRGYYQVFTPGGEVLVAVNADARESDLALMPAQTLQNWRDAVNGASSTAAVDAGQPAVAASAEEPEEIEIWRIFLALLALAVLAESLLGNRYLNLKTGTES
ncbi:MAG: BatA domain-containing protein [Pseudohongiellaceae bacterium]|jgi:hypothetical protein